MFFIPKNPTTPNFDQIHNQVLKPLHKASSYLINAFNREAIWDGSKEIDLPLFATDADIQIGKMLHESLEKKFPDFGFISEEEQQGKQSPRKALKEYNWIIDPVDGTMNFANKIPLFAISIALWKGNETVYAIVSLPMQGDIIHAIAGKGAFLNGKPLEKERQNLAKPYVVYAHIAKTTAEKLKLYEYLLQDDPFPRFLGSGVYQTTMVCLRRIDYAIFVNTAIWDIAATILIAKEAGLHAEFISPYPDLAKANSKIKEYIHSVVIGEKETALRVAQDVKKKLRL